MTNAVTIAQSGSTGSITGYRNRLINGSFDVWQRGTSFNNLSNVYTADRWKIGYQDDGAIYTQQVSDLPGFSLYMRMIKGGTANGSHMIQQAIETQNTVDMIGQWVTFSCWARLSNATTQATHQLNMALGFSATTDYSGWLNSADICSYYATWRATGANGVTFQAGTTSSTPSTPVQSVGTLTTTWQRYYYTLLVPTNTKTIVCGVYSEATLQNGGIDVDGIQFELGTSPSTFDRRHIQQELAMCQRYFEKSFNDGTAPTNGPNTTSFSTEDGVLTLIANNGSYGGGLITFKVTKRTTPGMVAFGNSNGHWGYGTGNIAGAGSLTWSGSTFGPSRIGTNQVSMTQQVVNGSYITIVGHWTANAEI